MAQYPQCPAIDIAFPAPFGVAGVVAHEQMDMSALAAVMNDASLHAMWVGEVTEMRTRIKAMRQKLFEVLSTKVPGRDFSYFINQRGMFSYTGFTPEQVDRLREEFAVYLIRSGRLCVAGLNKGNVEATAQAIAAVMG